MPTDLQKIFEVKNVAAFLNQEKEYMYLHWCGFQTDKDIKQSGALILDIFKELPCDKILNDTKDVQGIWQISSYWTRDTWFPQMIQAGLKKFAWVFPNNIFAELSASKAIPNNDLVHKFISFEKAEKWLLAEPTDTK